MKIELISAKGSNSSERVEWVLNFKKIPYQRTEHTDNLAAEYVKINPLLRVPSMRIDGTPLSESIVMIDFLERAVPQPALLPSSPLHRAKVLEICEIVNATIHPIQNSKVAAFFIPGITKEQTRPYRKKWIQINLEKLTPLLFKESSFAYGTEFSLADIFIIPIFRKALELGLEPNELADFLTHMNFCLSQKEIRDACPFELT